MKRGIVTKYEAEREEEKEKLWQRGRKWAGKEGMKRQRK